SVSAIAVGERSSEPPISPRGGEGGKSCPVRVSTTAQRITGTTIPIPHTRRDSPHPSAPQPPIGTASPEPAEPPRASATLYSVIRPTVRAAPCSLTQAGTSTLPSAGPTSPSTESSTNTANVPAEGRSSSPSATATKEATIVPVSPILRESGTASSPATPKISGGNAVSRPEAKAPWP